LGARTVPRTLIKGQFEALLSNLGIENADEKVFSTISFESDSFSVWYAGRMYTKDFDVNTRTHNLKIMETERKELDVLELGRVTCTSGVKVSGQGQSGEITSASVFRLDYSKLASLNEVIDNCVGLERLFGFLIGFRGKPPVFNVWQNKTYKIGEYDLRYDGKLDISGINWTKGTPPHRMNCVHLNGRGGATLESILPNFFDNAEDIVTRIHAVEFSRFFSNNLSERFSVIMPVLESYIKGKYIEGDERSYMDSEKAFFEYIDKSNSELIAEFAKKHIQVKDRKAPSLKTQLARAIDNINSYGFSFPKKMADRIQNRRARMFHSAPQMIEDDGRNFFDEICAATGLLMLHTYRDLGVDIASLAHGYSALSDFRQFLIIPTGKAKAGNAGDGPTT
jgi:hypothetical protein